jgi:hypothetical protein
MRKLVNSVLRQAYISLLRNNVIVDNISVPIYNKVPNNATKPLIEIIGQHSILGAEDTQDSFMTEAVIPIRILTASTGGAGGDEQAEEIANKVLNLLEPNIEGEYALILDDYKIVNIEHNLDTFNFQSGNEYQSHLILTVTHDLQQLT